MIVSGLVKSFTSLLLLLATLFSPALTAESNKISIITLDDKIINPIAAEYIQESIDRAEKERYQALVIQLDTPGGLLSSTRQIVKRILNAAVPVIVYVAPSGSRAGSAGVFITLASHIAVMAPSTNIGAAHPVEFGESPQKKDESFKELLKDLRKEKEKSKDQEKQEPSPIVGRPSGGQGEGQGEGIKSPMEEKILNDTVAWVSTIAETRGRNVEWAIRAVKQSISDGEEAALKEGVIDFIAKDLDELLSKVDGQEVKLAGGKTIFLRTVGSEKIVTEMNARQRFLDVLINPNIAYILMMLGFYGLLFEITHPGSWFPGVAGLICIILAFYAFHTLPTNYAGLALIILAMILFFAEIFVTSYGLLGVAGVVCLLLGSLFLVNSTAEFMKLSLSLVIPVVLSTGAIFFFLLSLAVRSQRRRSSSGVEGMIGLVGEMQEEGKVLVNGELWDTITKDLLTKGSKVKIVKTDGMKLHVSKS
ncbi:MAG: nodulation protein NfeD [Deltaproteobacteria bacterium]|nr:nodulation protein NfeD [Deltaproteobacteria bacterium]